MRISTKDWLNYIQKMRKLSDAAADAMQKYVQTHGFGNTDELIDYAYALVTKYGEGAAALACQMYDETAALSGKIVDAAVPAETATYEETAIAVEGSLIQSPTGQKLKQVADRLVKQAGADTTLQNARRDGAEWAWVPMGDTCAFCITLASRGWQSASKSLQSNHAQHIHANCDCQFAIRFDGKSGVKGYDPDVYKKMYDEAEGSSSAEKVKSLRRSLEDRDKINAQKRVAYAAKKANINKRQLDIISNEITSLDDEYVAKSVGAKIQNLDILDLATGDIYHLSEGSSLSNKEVFAGKGSKTEYRNAYKYAEKYGGEIKDWQHVKGNGIVSTPDGDFLAEIHWSQCEGIGKKDLFIKKWLE